MLDLNWVLVGIGIVQLVYIILAFHRRPVAEGNVVVTRRPGTIIIAVLMLLTWGAVGVDIYDRHFNQPDVPIDLIANYGHSPPRTFFMDVNAKPLGTIRLTYHG